MRVLVTGSSGLIGRWVVEALLKEGHVPVGLDRIRLPSSEQNIEIEVGDITSAQFVLAAMRKVMPDAVIHLAARIDLDEKRSLAGYAANIDGVRNIISAIRQVPSIRRMICTSSQLVCRVGYVPHADDDYCPNTLYGESKVMTERITREEDGGDVVWCLARPTTVWGPHMGAHYRRMLDLIAQGRFFHSGTSKLYKSYAYAGNIAHQYIKLLTAEQELVNRRTFYLADYEPLSLRDYLDGLAREIGAPRIPTLPLTVARGLALVGDGLNACGFTSFPFNSFRLKNILTEYKFDLSYTRQVCGSLPFSTEDGIRATASWYKTYLEHSSQR